MNTADLTDAHAGCRVVDPALNFKNYGKIIKFGGKITTVKCHEDNSLVKKALAEPGNGQVLVVDGGGSMRRALCGDNLAANGAKNGWAGVIVYGCIRDAEEISGIELGVKALNTNPVKTEKRNIGDRDVAVSFGGVTFEPGQFVYADLDGIIVADNELKL